MSFGQTSKEEPLQTPLEKALQWAEKGEPDIAVEGFVPPREERISFAALQPIAGTHPHLFIFASHYLHCVQGINGLSGWDKLISTLQGV